MTDEVWTGRWRRRYERERALSVSTWLLGPAAMRDLGLPARPPWYGLTRLGTNLLTSHVLGRSPAGRRRLVARGDRHARTTLARLGAAVNSR